MDSYSVESEFKYPVLFIPEKYTTIRSNCDVYIDVVLKSSPDRMPPLGLEGNSIFKGLCSIKLVKSPESTSETSKEEMPIGLPETDQWFPPCMQSKVWIDPSRSPYVYNHFVPTTNESYTNHESSTTKSPLEVKQHSTDITHNVNHYKEFNVDIHKEFKESPVKGFERERHRNEPVKVTTAEPDENSAFYEDDEFESCTLFPQLPDETYEHITTDWVNVKVAEEIEPPVEESDALKQLMSAKIQSTSKQRKKILFLGQHSQFGLTVENISYDDATLKCAELEVVNKILKESSPKQTNKKIQCDKCKQIFDNMSLFRQHMVRNHSKIKTFIRPEKKLKQKQCKKCGRCFKNESKYKIHCLAHGNPGLKCKKVFASKSSLRGHNETHIKKHSCPRCLKCYIRFNNLKMHMKKNHSLCVCQDEDCLFVCKNSSDLNLTLAGPYQDVSRSTQDVSGTNQDLIMSNPDVSNSNTLTGSNQDLPNSSQDISAGLSQDLAVSNQEQSSSSLDLRLNSDLVTSHEYLPTVDDNEEKQVEKAYLMIAKVMSSKIFLSSKTARNHKVRKTCEVCLKTFNRIDELKRHLIMHVVKSNLLKTPFSRTGNWSVICEVCHAATFTSVDKYKAHLQEHLKLTIYKCNICDKCFSDSSNFCKHKKIHSSSCFQCDLCKRKFSSKRTLEHHIGLHNKLSPVQCSFCDKRFPFQSTLNKHVRGTHKKFHCRLCNMICKSLTDKRDHEWRVHKVRKKIIDCLLCGLEFRKYSELKIHCRDEHGKVMSGKNSRKNVSL